MDACVSNRFRFIHCLRLTDPLKLVTSIGPMTAVRMQFRQTVIYDRRQIAYRLRARMEGVGKLQMIKVNCGPHGIEKIPDNDRTTHVGQMHPIVNKAVAVPIDLGMWY